MMTTGEINGFAFEPNSGNRFLFQRTTAPQHAYHVTVTSKHVEVIATSPVDVAQGDPLVDAKRFEPELLKAATRLKRRIFG